LESLKKLVH